MKFTHRTIAPAGRNKYGHYLSSGNITKSVISTTYAGNDTTTTIGDNGNNPPEETDIGFYCMLSKSSVIFNALDLVEGIQDSTMIIAYRGYTKAPTYVCDMESVSATTEDDIVTYIAAPANMGIQGLVSGLSVTFQDNGTSAATVTFYADSELTQNNGTIRIPAMVYKRTNATPNPDNLMDWWMARTSCEQVWLEYTWTVNRNGSSTYVMDLSNERAGVNVNSAGTIEPASIAALTCSAFTYYGTDLVAGVQYSVSTQPRYNAQGISIGQSDGVLHWANNFAFDGPNLPIDVVATLDGTNIATKTMNIEKNYPGSDGAPALTRWIVTSVDVVRYNPNTNYLDPSKVTAKVMKQVGSDEPVVDTDTTIYYGYDTATPSQPLPSTGATSYSNVSNIIFALKNSNNVYYEIETVPILWEGTNGTDGPQGPEGPAGPPGPGGGSSSYYLSLSNDNASINADASGNILTNAIKPTCQAKLYFGSSRLTSASYNWSASTPTTGLSLTTSNGVGTLNFASNFNFTGDVLSISVSGYSGTSKNYFADCKTMNVTKARAGASGESPISYWLDVNYGEIIYNPNSNSYSPSYISATSYQQKGEEAMIPSIGTTMKYSYKYRSNGSWTSPTDYTRGSAVNISTAICTTYSRIRFYLYKGSNQVDMEDVDIMMDGHDGTSGEGRAGAAIRGPYDFYQVSASTRCWCAGSSSSTCDDCDKWIDVILKDGTYYYCNTTYYGKLTPWSTYSSYWTAGDSFDFVATRVLLANNASIDFLTNNELYLRDSNGYITAGAKGGSGVNFWAGDDAPDPAPFMVYNDGTLVATKGTFGPFTIGVDRLSDGAITSSARTTEEEGRMKDEISLNTHMLAMQSTLSATSYFRQNILYIKPTLGDAASDLANGVIHLEMNKYKSDGQSQLGPLYGNELAIDTDGNIKGGRLITKRGCTVSSRGVLDNEIIYTTTASSLFQKTSYWYIDGNNTGIPTSQPRALFRKGAGRQWYFAGENLGAIATASTPTFTTGSSSEQTWTFNGADLGIDPTLYSNVHYSQTLNAWAAYYYSSEISTGIEHSTSGYATPNAVYVDVKGDYPIDVTGTPTLYGYVSSTNRGTYREYLCEPGSNQGSGNIVLSISSEGTMSDISIYTSDSWISASRTSSAGIRVTVTVSSNSSGERWGYVEIFNKRRLGVRIIIKQSME